MRSKGARLLISCPLPPFRPSIRALRSSTPLPPLVRANHTAPHSLPPPPSPPLPSLAGGGGSCWLARPRRPRDHTPPPSRPPRQGKERGSGRTAGSHADFCSRQPSDTVPSTAPSLVPVRLHPQSPTLLLPIPLAIGRQAVTAAPSRSLPQVGDIPHQQIVALQPQATTRPLSSAPVVVLDLPPARRVPPFGAVRSRPLCVLLLFAVGPPAVCCVTQLSSLFTASYVSAGPSPSRCTSSKVPSRSVRH